VTEGGWAISQSQRADATHLHLLFAKGKRPDRAAVRAFAARQQAVGLSHGLQSDDVSLDDIVPAGQPIWAELLCDGLTFDLSGFAPGLPSAFPAIAHRFDLAELPAPDAYEALSIMPGPHLIAGARSLPVVRAMLALAKQRVAEGRPLIIFPEGTRVAHGHREPLQAGFAGLYKLLRLPVVPIAVDSGRAYHRAVKRPGRITYKVGAAIPAGLPRADVEARVHAAINALNG